MPRKYSRCGAFVVAMVTCMLIPQSILAAELMLKVLPNSETIEVRIDPQSKNINVVEGALEFSGTASDGLSVYVENGQSILPIWPTPPLYDRDNKRIDFTGGIPNGFDSEGLLFRLRLLPAAAGELNIVYSNGSAYLNDGMGTKEAISSEPFKINIAGDGLITANEGSFNLDKYYYAIIILTLVAVLFFVFKKWLQK